MKRTKATCDSANIVDQSKYGHAIDPQRDKNASTGDLLICPIAKAPETKKKNGM